MINQLSIFVQNTSGRLASALEYLAEANIDIRALSLADTTDFGILRIIVNDTKKAMNVLKEHNRIVNITPVVAVALDDKPGGLAKITNIISNNHFNIDYMYAFVSSYKSGAYVVLKVDNPEDVTKLLNENDIQTLTEQDIQNF